jgi:hypothetical protein
MSEWEPISLTELENLILKQEWERELSNFWVLIKVDPVKWIEETYGDVGNGFWVVAICGTNVVWYNDIEDGFNISSYTTFGVIDEYYCNQDSLTVTVQRLFQAIISGKQSGLQRRLGEPLI